MSGPGTQTVVVGAGVVGLAIARELALAGHEVLVIERHDGIGRETSSRSSEVIHAGLYYPPGSLKARLCVAGNRRLYAFAREAGIPHRRPGKLVVATSEADREPLAALARTAAANGVDDLVPLSRSEALALEPALACSAALLSPSTGVIDSHALLLALEGHLTTAGGQVVLRHDVTDIAARTDGMFALTLDAGGAQSRLTTRNLVIAAGLEASRLGSLLTYRTGYRVPPTYPARGHYYGLTAQTPFRHLVYPLPHAGWLGIHLTQDVAGRARFGPDLEWQAGPAGAPPDYRFDDRGGARLRTFEREIRRYWPALPDDSLVPDAVGVRPKLYRDGEPVPDFAIHGEAEHGLARLVALYGIESPGLTSSLAIGALVAGLLPRP